MPDSATAIARDMIAEVGRGTALGYLFGRLIDAQSWRGVWRAVRLIAAIVAA